MPASDQSEVLAFLEGGGLGAIPERIDTHAAIVLLTPDRAYKLKRPVRYSFLDFTTLERREQTLRHELELNRKHAPELYLRVLPVTADPAGLALDGNGPPVEWLLEMRRFPAEAELDRVAAATGLPDPWSTASPRPSPPPTLRPHPAPTRAATPPCARSPSATAPTSTPPSPASSPPTPSARLDALTQTSCGRHGPLLDRRRAEGRVRHCHGDLHLANIVLLGDRPVLFDCIEFDDDFACIDVLYDLAFLLMDLIERATVPPPPAC